MSKQSLVSHSPADEVSTETSCQNAITRSAGFYGILIRLVGRPGQGTQPIYARIQYGQCWFLKAGWCDVESEIYSWSIFSKALTPVVSEEIHLQSEPITGIVKEGHIGEHVAGFVTACLTARAKSVLRRGIEECMGSCICWSGKEQHSVLTHHYSSPPDVAKPE